MSRLVPGRSRDRRRRWTLAFAYTALLASCDSPFAPDVEEVTRLEVTPSVLQLAEGGNATLTARVFGADDAPILTARVYWSSQNPGVVTVDQAGVATAVAAGTAQIAASSGGMSRTIAVTVSPRPIALIRISPPAGTVVTGGSLTLQGEALDGTGALLPNRPLEWSSSAPDIATVSQAGIVTGVAVGETTISATGEGRTGTAIITVLPAPVASITISPPGGSLPAGGTLTFSATPRDAAGQPLTGRALEWRSSNDAVATISGSGLLTALAQGEVTITVSAPGAGPNGSTPTASVSVTVLIIPVANAVIVPSPASVQVRGTLNLTVNLLDGNGEPLSPAGRSITWASSDVSFATVNQSGMVTGVAAGSATITATITTPGQPAPVQATVQVSVSSQPVASVVITPSPAVVHAGYARAFTAVARDAGGNPLPGRVIVWTSSSQGVAVVDATSGMVTGISPGAVEIRATSDGIQGVANVTVDLVRVTSVTVTPGATTLMPGQTVQLSAQPRDSAGTVIQGSALGGRATSWASQNTAAATVSATGLVTAVAQGTAAIIASVGGTPGQSDITVNPLPGATQLAVTTQPSASPQNNVPFPVQPVVRLRDVSGNNVLTAGVVVQAAITAPGTGTLGGTVTATTDASGTATFTNLRITGTTGPRTLTFTSGTLVPATSAPLTLLPGAATHLAITTPPPGAASSGQVFGSATVVQLRDFSGNPVPQSGVAITTAVNPPAGVTLGGGTTTTNGSGAATFGALTLTGPAGSYTLTFSSASLTPATSGPVALSAGSGSRLAITVQPSATAKSGAIFGVQPVIQLVDGSNNPVAQAGVNISAAIFSGGGSLGGTTVATTNASGTATFANLSISGTIGDRTLLFGAPAYTAVTSGSITITAGDPAALSIATPPPSSAQSGVALVPQPAIQLRDASGNAAAQAGVVVSVTLNGAGGSLIGTTTATTNASGLATFTGVGIAGTVNSYSLSFASTGLTGTSSGSIALSAGAASQLTITTQPAGAASGSAFTTQPAVQVRDANGNIVNQAGISLTAAVASGPGATLTGTTTATTNGSGLAIFSGLTLTGTVGSYTLGFTSAGLSPATSAGFTLAPGAPAQMAIQVQPAGAVSGAAFTTQPTVLVRDAQGNTVTTAGITVTASISSGAGASLIGATTAQTTALGVATFSGLGLSGLAGSYTLDFSTAGAPNVTSGAIALGAGAATQLTMATQPSATVASGSALGTPPAVQLRDAGGNPVAQAGVSVTVSIGAGASLAGGTVAATDGSGVATFTGLGVTGLVGSYTLSFSASGLTGATSSAIGVTPGPATQLAMVTQPSASALSGAPFGTQPAVRLRDAAGNNVGQAGVNVSVGVTGGGATLNGTTTVATDGVGVATFAGLNITNGGTWTLTFTSGGLTSVTSSAIVVSEPATQLAVTGQPSPSAQNGVMFGAQPSVQLRTAANAPANQAGVMVTVELSGGSGTLFGTASAATDPTGTATFAGLGITGAVGNYTLTFKSSGLTDAVSNAIALAAGAPAKLQVQTEPGGGTANLPLSPQPVLVVLDAQDNIVPTAGISVTASLNDPGSTGAGLSGASAITNSSGTAAFGNLTISAPGTFTVTFTSPGLTGVTSGQIVVIASYVLGRQDGTSRLGQPSLPSIGAPSAPQGTPMGGLNTLGLIESPSPAPGRRDPALVPDGASVRPRGTQTFILP